ncbi:DUF5958 family protein [Kitasatospora camelliae]|uniref:DUF5958 family protein n=1 Tax=Kitasatospora camelliae TaxID=3156397 RepID=A0AAU8JR76_9ACTN
MHDRNIILNELAQGLRPMDEGVRWFEGLAEEDRRLALRSLVHHSYQARAVPEDVAESIARSGIRPTHTPAVMLSRWRFGMDGLPAYELTKSFRLLVALLAVADTRRRERQCADGCTHAWHHLAERDRNPL